MTPWYAGLAAGAAVLLLARAPTRERTVLRALAPRRPPPRPHRRAAGGALTTPGARRAVAAVAGLAVAAAVGGRTGVVAGVAIALLLPGALARLPAESDPTDATAELPLALDVAAACLAAGAPLALALDGAADVLGGPLAARLREVVAHLRLGADARRAWATAADNPSLAPLAEVATRVAGSGAALAPALRQLAAELRERQRQDQQAAVQRAAVLVVVPLGLCFLPAFILVGVVPVVAGLLPAALT